MLEVMAQYFIEKSGSDGGGGGGGGSDASEAAPKAARSSSSARDKDDPERAARKAARKAAKEAERAGSASSSSGSGGGDGRDRAERPSAAAGSPRGPRKRGSVTAVAAVDSPLSSRRGGSGGKDQDRSRNRDRDREVNGDGDRGSDRPPGRPKSGGWGGDSGGGNEPPPPAAALRGAPRERAVQDMEVEEMEDFDSAMGSMSFGRGGSSGSSRSGGGGGGSLSSSSSSSSHPSSPISAKTAAALRTLIFGDQNGSWNKPWMVQNFDFTKNRGLEYGLVQKEGGPCGVVASVQAFVLKALIDGKNLKAGEAPSRDVLNAALAKALADILWGIGDRKSAIVVLKGSSSSRAGAGPPGYKADGMTEKCALYEFRSYDSLHTYLTNGKRTHRTHARTRAPEHQSTRALVRRRTHAPAHVWGHARTHQRTHAHNPMNMPTNKHSAAGSCPDFQCCVPWQ